VLIVVLLAGCASAVVFAVAFAVVRCRRAGRLIDRILAEELDPEPAAARGRAGVT
jgi:hypothetical protein